VLYPLQTFTKNKPLSNKNFPVFIEGNNPKMVALIKKLALTISKEVRELNSDDRKTLHVAAVFACNFTNHLYAQADKLLKEKKISFELFEPLLKETVSKAVKLSPAVAQTGPAIRDDNEIIDQHLKLLQRHPDMVQIYKVLTESIRKSRKK
jgi:predicted short-subunit dehydrogenase-like oxidoreductase (DUF2520 family)